MPGGGARPKRKRKPKTASGRRRAENRRLERLLEVERSFWERGIETVAGVDEVGRGPLAGPVLAAAVILPAGVSIRGIDDSKKLDARRRESLFLQIREVAAFIGVGAASTREIDRINILRATHLAMRRAIGRLGIEPDRIIVDGLPVDALGESHVAIVGADASVHCVACASVVAKVVRDRLMKRLDRRYPGYGWADNAGYGTAEHRDAILSLGLTPHHRRSFEPRTQLELF